MLCVLWQIDFKYNEMVKGIFLEEMHVVTLLRSVLYLWDEKWFEFGAYPGKAWCSHRVALISCAVSRRKIFFHVEAQHCIQNYINREGYGYVSTSGIVSQISIPVAKTRTITSSTNTQRKHTEKLNISCMHSALNLIKASRGGVMAKMRRKARHCISSKLLACGYRQEHLISNVSVPVDD